MVLREVALGIGGGVQCDPHGRLVVHHSALGVELDIVAAVETAVPEHIVYFETLVGRVEILQLDFDIAGGNGPRFLRDGFNFSHFLLHLELWIINPVFYSLFDLTDILVDFLGLSLYFVTDIGVN
jgi:hypothetical protein